MEGFEKGQRNTTCTHTHIHTHTHTHTQNETEAMLMEFNSTMGELIRTIDNLKDWMAPKSQPTDLLNKFNSVYIQPEPYGVVLIIAPWNYPFSLLAGPLIGAIAAGKTSLTVFKVVCC